MPKLRKEDVADLDIEALDAVEYSTEEFDTYDGEVPPVGTELTGYVKRMWWTRTAQKPNGGGDDPMLKVLWVAADNEGDEEEYNDCGFWLNAPLIPTAKFRWAPFLEVYGLTLKQIKTATYVAPKEDQNGAPIERIGSWKPGEDSDAAWCRIISGQEPYNGEMQPRVKEWLLWDGEEPGEEAEEPGEEEGEEPELFENEDGELVDADGNLVDEDGNLLEPEEEEAEEPEPPARTRRTAKAAPARAARTASKAPATRSAAKTPARAAKSAPATTRTRAAAPARAAKATATKATRGRGRAAAAQDEPPF
jgi:hypothetical protein